MTITTSDNASSIAELERLKVLHNGHEGKADLFQRRI